jgi:hypothetical protein
MPRLLLGWLPLTLFLASCSSGAVGRDGGAGAAALHADPPGLGFDCVAPGCNQEKTLRLVSDGPGPARIFSVALDLTSSQDFELGALQPLPLDLAPGEATQVAVVYRPSDAVSDTGALVVEYGPPGAVTRQTLRVEFVVRLLGVAAADVTPTSLAFGYVPVGQHASLDVTVRNIGTGNALLQIPSVTLREGTAFSVSPAVPPALVLGAGQELRLSVTYQPPAEGAHVDRLTVATSDPERPSIAVLLRGTTIQGPRLNVDPAGPVALGDVRVGRTAEQVLVLGNYGGQPLWIQSLAFSGTGASHFQTSVTSMPPLAPFETAPVTVTYAPTSPGEHYATLTIVSNDPVSPSTPVSFTGRGIDPRLVVTPQSIDYGRVVTGWTRGPTPVRVQNGGFGPLEVQRVYLAPGSSSEFILGTLPGLPLTLNQGNELELQIRYVAASVGPVQARLRVETDAAENPSAEVSLSAEGTTCAVGCAMDHATPRCDTGICAIQACDSGYHDTDGQASSGCECKIESPEPSSFCAEATHLGQLDDGDGGHQFVVQGQLHRPDDVDWYSFYGNDQTQFGSDRYGVRITLTSPAGRSYKMCVFKAKRSPHSDVCPPEASQACTGVTSYTDLDNTWGDDSSDYFIKVYTTEPQTSCAPYTLTMRNGE